MWCSGYATYINQTINSIYSRKGARDARKLTCMFVVLSDELRRERLQEWERQTYPAGFDRKCSKRGGIGHLTQICRVSTTGTMLRRRCTCCVYAVVQLAANRRTTTMSTREKVQRWSETFASGGAVCVVVEETGGGHVFSCTVSIPAPPPHPPGRFFHVYISAHITSCTPLRVFAHVNS